MIIVKEDILSKKECKLLIDIHEQFKNWEEYKGTDVFRFSEHWYHVLLGGHLNSNMNPFGDSHLQLYEFTQYILAKINGHIQSIDSKSYMSYAQIVRWNEGSYQPLHYDHKGDEWTSIFYLNDADGGDTIIGDERVSPKQGRVVTFNGGSVKHGVDTVKSGKRYTIPVWYHGDFFKNFGK